MEPHKNVENSRLISKLWTSITFQKFRNSMHDFFEDKTKIKVANPLKVCVFTDNVSL